MYARPSENVTRQIFRRVLDIVVPAVCLACNGRVQAPTERLGLCDDCYQRLPRWPRSCCSVCGRTVEAPHLPADYRCGPCRKQKPPVRILSVWSYESPIDAVLTALKFRRLEYLGAQLARSLAAHCEHKIRTCELVVPVPLHWRRHLSRGYNQAATIARPLAKQVALPYAALLRRRLATPAQSRLGRAERTDNLRGAFKVRRPSRCQSRHILLIDDVVTTGTTLNTAARCLLAAGAASVTALTAARTPEQP